MFKSLMGDTKSVAHESTILRQAIKYHLFSGGQRLRARLALDAGEALSLYNQDNIVIAAAVELIHNASLIHDDLQDGDQFRRSLESVWSKFGSNEAICCGDFYLSCAYSSITSVSKTVFLPKMIRIMHQRIAEASHGQSADLNVIPEQLDLETYIRVVMAKSGALLSLPLELVLIYAGFDEASHEARQACRDFAVGFQIFDDLRDLATDTRAVEDGGNRLNITRIVEHQAAKEIASMHLKSAELLLTNLPARAGSLLEECAKNITRLLNAIH